MERSTMSSAPLQETQQPDLHDRHTQPNQHNQHDHPQLKHQQLPHQQLPHQQLPHQQLPHQHLPHQQLPNQQLPNQQLSMQQLPNQQLPNQQLPNQQLPHQSPALQPSSTPPSDYTSSPSDSSSLGFLPTHRKSSRRKQSTPLSFFQAMAQNLSPKSLLLCLPMRKLSPIMQSKAFIRMRQSVVINALFGISISFFLTLATSYFTLRHARAYHFRNNPMDAFSDHPMSHISAELNATLQSSLSNDQSVRHLHLVLEESFSVPPSLSLKIPVAQRYELLTQLQSSKPSRSNMPPRLFVLHTIANTAERRFHAIATAITYALNTDRLLVVLWDTTHGAEGYGADVVRHIGMLPSHDLILAYVDGLHLAPNVTHWSEYSINYMTTVTDDAFPLDRVADLATRHLFYRADGAVEGRYASMLPGVMRMSRMLHVGPKGRREWDSFIKHWTFPQLDSGVVSDTLNRVYGVPWVFINGMLDEKQRLLLRLLNKSTSKRAFFIHAQYGLGNRLRALGSAMAIAHVTGRVLVLIWEPDVHLDCGFNDLFVNEYVLVEKLNMNWPPKGRATKDRAMQTVDFYNFMRNEGDGRHNPMKELVNPHNGRHVYVKSAYVVRSSFTPRIISPRSDYWKIMREELVPRVEIMMMVLDPMFAKIHEMIGVHIRARTIENDIKGIGHEFYGSASRTTDHWRKRTGLRTFESKIMRLSSKYKYFVAADMKEAIHELERKFGSHRIVSVGRDGDCVTRDVECAKLALVDILLLSRVSTLLGSHWSSFSEAAIRLSGHVKVLLAGLHFG